VLSITPCPPETKAKASNAVLGLLWVSPDKGDASTSIETTTMALAVTRAHRNVVVFCGFDGHVSSPVQADESNHRPEYFNVK
tara:strand:+ start:151 stop:396 length:246 start_codon:yes stop_codon:yes gene_type:complete